MDKKIRRNISGIYIFEKFEGECKSKPTCIEDCSEETRNNWLESLEKKALINCVNHLCETLNNITEQFDKIAK